MPKRNQLRLVALLLFFVGSFLLPVFNVKKAQAATPLTDPAGAYTFKLLNDAKPVAKPNLTVDPTSSTIFGGSVQLDAATTQSFSAGNNRTLGFKGTVGQPAGRGIANIEVLVSIDVCNPTTNKSADSKFTGAPLWFSETLAFFARDHNQFAGVTDNPELLQTINDAYANNDSASNTTNPSSSNGRCGTTIITTTAADLLKQQITITLDLDEAYWKQLVAAGTSANYPTWFAYDLVRDDGNGATALIGRQIIDITKLITNHNGGVNIVFQSADILPNHNYFLKFFNNNSFSNDNLNKKDPTLAVTRSYDPNNSNGDPHDYKTTPNKFFDWLKSIFPNNLDPKTPPQPGQANGGTFGTTADSAAAGGANGPLSATGDDNVNCDTSGNPMSWLICPIINGALDGASLLFTDFIEPFLHTSPVTTDPSPNNVIFHIWNSFRTIGNILLVFALLFVVFGQSIGGGLIDAYTAKKAIPRILVAAIAINLSIYICAMLIDLFNILGNGMAHLITSPLKDTTGTNNNNALSIRPKAGESAVLFIIAILGGIATFKLFKLIGKNHAADAAKSGGTTGSVIAYLLVFVALPIILAALSIFITLLLRQGIILALTAISPVALALFAIPAADKYAKKWLDAFVKTLIVYPIITGIFAISQVLAVLIYDANDGGVLALIAVAIVAFAPLFMIPFAFKLAGGVIGGAAGAIVSGRDRLKKVYGDDKHNPYSARMRMSHGISERVGHRVKVGAANDANSLINRWSSDQTRKEAEAANAAGDASKSAREYAKTNGNNPQESSRAKSYAAKSASDAVIAGGDKDDAALAGSMSAEMSLSGNGYDDESIYAAGEASAHYRRTHKNDTGYSDEHAKAAGRVAANLTNRGYKDKNQIRAASTAAGNAHKTYGGNIQAVAVAAETAVKAHQAVTDLAKNPGATPLPSPMTHEMVNAASIKAAEEATKAAMDPTRVNVSEQAGLTAAEAYARTGGDAAARTAAATVAGEAVR